MTFDEYRDYLASAFPEMVRRGTRHPEYNPPFIQELFAPAKEHFKKWGYQRPSDCFQDAVPRSDTPTLEAFSEGIININHWRVKVSCACFVYGLNHVHLEIQNMGDAPLPFTETGYKSYHIPLPTFEGNRTALDFVEAQFPDEPQLSFF